jgi:hypothetical protein
MKKGRLIILFLSGILSVQVAYAQESVNAAGGDASGSGGSVAYSIGQVIYTTNTDSSGTISQGVQQAYEIYLLGISETPMNPLLSIFPNPTADYLTLQISDYKAERLSYQLVNLEEKVLLEGQVTGEKTKINTAQLPSSTYLIHITNQVNKQLQSYKIIKH